MKSLKKITLGLIGTSFMFAADAAGFAPIGAGMVVIGAGIGIGMFALPAGILASGFSETMEAQKKENTKCPHCGKDINH